MIFDYKHQLLESVGSKEYFNLNSRSHTMKRIDCCQLKRVYCFEHEKTYVARQWMICHTAQWLIWDGFSVTSISATSLYAPLFAHSNCSCQYATRKKQPSSASLVQVEWVVSMHNDFLKQAGKSNREQQCPFSNWQLNECRVHVCDLPQNYEKLKHDFQGNIHVNLKEIHYH